MSGDIYRVKSLLVENALMMRQKSFNEKKTLELKKHVGRKVKYFRPAGGAISLTSLFIPLIVGYLPLLVFIFGSALAIIMYRAWRGSIV